MSVALAEGGQPDMAGLGAMVAIADLAVASLDFRHGVERVRAWMASSIPQVHRPGHHAH